MEYDQNQAFGEVIDVLEAIGAQYAIWGGMAVIVYGEPRFTQDLDILLSPSSFSITNFVKRLKESTYHVDEISVRNALADGGFFNVIHLHYAIKVDFYVPTEPHLKAMINSGVSFPFDMIRRAKYVTADDLIKAKLIAFKNSESTRHLDDIASIIRIQEKNLDYEDLELFAARIGALGAWRAVLDSIG